MRFQKYSWALTLIALLIILLLSFATTAGAEVKLLTADRVLYLISFATFIIPSAVLDPRGSRSVLAFGLSLVLLVEVFQPIFGQIASGIDIMAGILGLGLGAILGTIVRRRIF